MAQRNKKGECMQRETEPDRESPRQVQQKEMRDWEAALRKTDVYWVSKACEAFVVGTVIRSGTWTQARCQFIISCAKSRRRRSFASVDTGCPALATCV